MQQVLLEAEASAPISCNKYSYLQKQMLQEAVTSAPRRSYASKLLSQTRTDDITVPMDPLVFYKYMYVLQLGEFEGDCLVVGRIKH